MELVIRKAERSDAAAIRDIYAQSHAYESTLQLPYPSVESWDARCQGMMAEGHHNLVAELNAKVVGQLCLTAATHPRRKHTAEFGMGVCDSARRQGVGSALLKAAIELCDKWLNIERIELEVYTDNVPALQLYKKFGFVVEGEHKRSAFRGGEYVDVFSMARLKNESSEITAGKR